MGAPATGRPGAAKSPAGHSGSPFHSGRSWAPIPCSYSDFILRATKLESKVYHLIWSQTWGLRDVEKRREWTEGLTAEGIARIVAATQSGVSHVLPKLRKDGWIGRRRGTKHMYQYTLLDGPVPTKGLPLPETPKRHAKAKAATIKGLTDIAARRSTLRLAETGAADTCRNAPECTLTLADIAAAQEVASNRLVGILQHECTLTLAGIPATPCLPKKEFSGINCGHSGCHLFKPATEPVTAPADHEGRMEVQVTEPGSQSDPELYHRLEHYLAQKLEPIVRKRPPANVLHVLVEKLKARRATFEHFAAYFECESDRMNKKGDPIRSYGFALTIAGECSTSDPLPVVDEYGSPKEKRYAERRLREARENGDS
jgi:hypothetical protein